MKLRLGIAIVVAIVSLCAVAIAATARHLEWYGSLHTAALSGYGGQVENFGPASGPNRKAAAISGFRTFYRMAIPSCGLRANQVSLDTARQAPLGSKLAFEKCTNTKMNINVPDGMAVRGIQICSSTDVNKGILGMRLWPAVINSSGAVIAAPGKVEQRKSSRCEWRGKSMCPTGQVAVEAIASNDGRSTYTGIRLKCAKVRKP